MWAIHMCDKYYHILNLRENRIDKATKENIVKNVKALFCNIGGILL